MSKTPTTLAVLGLGLLGGAIAQRLSALLLLSDAQAIESTLFADAVPVDLRGRCLVQMGTIGPGQLPRPKGRSL